MKTIEHKESTALSNLQKDWATLKKNGFNKTLANGLDKLSEEILTEMGVEGWGCEESFNELTEDYGGLTWYFRSDLDYRYFYNKPIGGLAPDATDFKDNTMHIVEIINTGKVSLHKWRRYSEFYMNVDAGGEFDVCFWICDRNGENLQPILTTRDDIECEVDCYEPKSGNPACFVEFYHKGTKDRLLY